MSEFDKAFKKLNDEQKKAVEQIEGPVLVIAGPGTGKTQLLSTRIAHILKTTDTPPGSILCLTFTDSGAETMRRRLQKIIGDVAYEVQIYTYHAFGSDLLRRYPQFAGDAGLEAIDELGRYKLLDSILERAPHDLPLKNSRQTIKSIISLISDAKKALLSPDDIANVAKANQAQIKDASTIVSKKLDSFKSMNKKSAELFASLVEPLKKITVGSVNLPIPIQPLLGGSINELEQALEFFELSGGKTTKLTVWKNRWLAKNATNQWIFGGDWQQRRLMAFSKVYRDYQASLQAERLFDFDDMILRSISALEQNLEFKNTLAEQYLYIMLDEFQDTNLAQLKIVQLLSDSPVHERRPNIMAVGDDDQAIYAFQGADYSNMKSFADSYRDTTIVCLVENYRSHGNILHLADGVASQIDGRLIDSLPNVSKTLRAVGESAGRPCVLARHDFLEPSAQYEWVASEITKLRKIDPKFTIGVLAPKHRHIEPLVAHLNKHGVAMSYERRENIFYEPAVHQLLTCAQLVTALASEDIELADSLWPEVLSYDFWGVSTKDIWQIVWHAKDQNLNLSRVVMDNPKVSKIYELLGRLASLHYQTTLEQQLDGLIGYDKDQLKELKLPMLSPYYEYYFGRGSDPQNYLQVLSQLSVLREALRERQVQSEKPLKLADLVTLASEYELADIKLLNTSPLHQSDNAVELMTAYKAKGREFDVVFCLNIQDEGWGPLASGQADGLSLPTNLSHIRYQGDSDDERLRLLFVAITRAKTNLYLTNFLLNPSGKRTHSLRYLHETINKKQFISPLLPSDNRQVIYHADAVNAVEAAQLDWQSRHLSPFKPELKALLENRLQKFALSPTHINTFTDVIYGGPQAFFVNTLLAFPKAPAASGQFGNAVHETMQWLGIEANKGHHIALLAVLAYFEQRLVAKKLSPQDTAKQLTKGQAALSGYLAHHADNLPKAGEQFEVRFRYDGVMSGLARLNGVIDRLILDPKTKTATVIDYKTGAPAAGWDKGSPKHHRYIQQLLSYKLLVEGSRRFSGYKLGRAGISFIEPDQDGRYHELWLEGDDLDTSYHLSLIEAVWSKITRLDFPDISGYKQTIAGVRQFEQDLIDNRPHKN